MARLLTSGAEFGGITAENLTAGGTTPTIQTGTVRSGARAYSFTAVQQTYLTITTAPGAGVTQYLRGYFNFTAFPHSSLGTGISTGLPSLLLATSAGVFTGAVTVHSDGKVRLFNLGGGAAYTSGTQVGSDGPALNLNQWYMIEMGVRIGAGATDYLEARVDTASFASSSALSITDTQPTALSFGWWDNTAANPTAASYADDLAINDSTAASQTSWPSVGKVVLLKPTSDNSRAGFGVGAGTNQATTTNLWDAVDNTPQTGVAIASSTTTTQIKDKANNSTDQYTANLAAYTTAVASSGGGLIASDVVTLVQTVGEVGQDSATATSFGLTTTNPTIAEFTGSGPAAIAGTAPTNWTRLRSAVQYAPGPTLATQPTLKVRKNTSSNTIAQMVDIMGLLVEYRQVAYTGTASDSVTVGAGTASHTGTRARTASDSATVAADTATRGVGVPKTASDSVTVAADTATQTIGRARTASDSVTVAADTATQVFTRVRTASDTVTVGADTATRANVARARTASDSVTVGADTATYTQARLPPFSDDFASGPDPTLWDIRDDGTTTPITGGTFGWDQTGASGFAAIQASNTAMQDYAISLEIIDFLSTDVNDGLIFSYLAQYDNFGAHGGGSFTISPGGTGLTWVTFDGSGIDTGLGGSIAYNPVTHRFIRLRNASGTLYFETSANGTAWTTRHSEATDSSGYSDITIFATLYPGSRVEFDNFNVLPTSTETPMTLSATSPLVTTRQLLVGRTLTGSQGATATHPQIPQVTYTAAKTGTATLLRTIQTTLAVAQATAAVVVKIAQRTLSATATATATVAKVGQLTYTASVTASATVARTIQRTLAVALVLIATILRLGSRTLTASTVTNPTVVKSVTKTFQATATAVATLSVSYLSTLTGAVTVTPSMVKNIYTILVAQATATASDYRDTARSLLASVTPVATVNTVLGKLLSTTQSQQVTMIRVYFRSLIATVTAVPALSYTGVNTIELMVTQALDATKILTVARSLATDNSVVASFSSTVPRLITLATSVSLSASLIIYRFLARTLSAVLTPSASLSRMTSRTLSATKSLTATKTVAAVYARTLLASVSATATVSGLRALTLSATQTVSATRYKVVGRVLRTSKSVSAVARRTMTRLLTASRSLSAQQHKVVALTQSAGVVVSVNLYQVMLILYLTTLNAAVGTIAMIQLTVARVLRASQTSAATFVRVLGKVLRVTKMLVATRRRTVFKTTTSSVTVTARLYKTALILQQASLLVQATLSMVFGRIISATQASAATVQRTIGFVLSTVVVLAPHVYRQVARTLSTTVALVATLIRLPAIIANYVSDVTLWIGTTLQSYDVGDATLIEQIRKIYYRFTPVIHTIVVTPDEDPFIEVEVPETTIVPEDVTVAAVQIEDRLFISMTDTVVHVTEVDGDNLTLALVLTDSRPE